MPQQTPPSTNHLLGYPPAARLLIINADDLGMCHAINLAIFQALTEGCVSSTTLMPPAPWADHALRWLAAHPAIPFGIHLTAISDGQSHRWRPLSARERVPSLVDETGHFYPFDRMGDFFAQVDLGELETEFRAQIEWVLAAGLHPTHLDWHSLRIHRKPQIFDVLFQLAREYRLALRVREQPLIQQVRQRGLPSNDYDFLDSSQLASANKLETYCQLLRGLPSGLSEWAVHPGLADAELRALEPDGAASRQADLDCLTAPRLRDMLQHEGIILLNYRTLQAVWQSV